MSEENKTELKQESGPKRKIIQISSATTNAGRIVVIALCSDGTLWRRDAILDDVEWQQIKSI
jgi:hypothetical protein